MTSNTSFVFVILPCIAAVTAGLFLFDWRLAAATACGAIGLLFIAPLMPNAVRLFGSSIISGVAVGSLALVVVLLIRPTTAIWTRMTIAMLAAFSVHYLHLILTVGSV
ncbi:hypothetical protein OAN307_c06670 [Octadecabacter antarcticus 307]|uniref:Uncharacterized protein n=1 Tax=Octadecabacter antarcticus 307 TaxID=391626 RepID=B5J1Z6_9RHOB|nr:hypothetical protein [Octadecabacter antarcticus]AGI66394.1 hypothetical protein OAN307_c06670 [Octadecabacter antarcticus 307]